MDCVDDSQAPICNGANSVILVVVLQPRHRVCDPVQWMNKARLRPRSFRLSLPNPSFPAFSTCDFNRPSPIHPPLPIPSSLAFSLCFVNHPSFLHSPLPIPSSPEFSICDFNPFSSLYRHLLIHSSHAFSICDYYPPCRIQPPLPIPSSSAFSICNFNPLSLSLSTHRSPSSPLLRFQSAISISPRPSTPLST